MKGTVLKKLTAVFISLCMLLTVSSAVLAAGGYAVKIDEVTVTGGEVTSVDMTVAVAGTYTVYAAVYEEDTLVGAASETKELSQWTDSVTFTDPVSFDESAQTLKCYVWDGYEPVAEVYIAGVGADSGSTEPEDTTGAFVATFAADEHVASITVSKTQDFTDADNLILNAETAYSRDGDTGEIVTTAEAGQINFIVNLEDGYEIDTVTATEGTYTNVKIGTAGKLDYSNAVRITKVKGDMTVTIKTKEVSVEEAETGSGTITYSGTSVSYDGDTGVSISGTTATINKPGTYTVTGSLDSGTDGRLEVNYTTTVLDKKGKAIEANITLNGVTLSNGSTAPFYGTDGKVTLVAASGTTNTFNATSSSTKAKDNVAVYSKDDLTIKSADETAYVVANSTNGKGIQSGADIEIGTGNVKVNSYDNGIQGKKSVKITAKNTSVDVTTTGDGDGIKSNKDPSLAAEDYSSGGTVTINGGTITIKTGSVTTDGVTSTGDGIQADTLLTIANSPTITINATGEALKANASSIAYIEDGTDQATTQTHPDGDGCIVISGGTLDLTAGEDGIKAVKNVTISGGSVTITKAQDGIQVKEIVYDADDTTVLGYVEGSINLTDGTVNIAATEDGIQCGTGNIVISGGNVTVDAGLDGIQAEETLYISDGTFDITTGGGSPEEIKWNGEKNGLADKGSCKGLKAANLIYITGGSFELDTYEDAIHTNNTVQLLGGTYNIATGDDGVHGDSYLIVDGDNTEINISMCYEGLEAAKIYMNGGSSRIYAGDDGINAAGDEPSGSALDLSSSGISLNSISLAAFGDGGMNNNNDATYGYLEINGGYIYVNNTKGDGIDANGNMKITGGVAIVDGATLESEDGLDFDGTVDFDGGYVFTITAGGMDSISGTKNQKYLLYGFTSNGQGGFNGGKPGGMGGPGQSQSSGSSLSAGNYCIVDSSNNVICAFSRTKGSIQRVLLTSPNVGSNTTYYIKPLTVSSGVTATDSIYGTINSDYSFTLADGCSVGSGTSYTMTAN